MGARAARAQCFGRLLTARRDGPFLKWRMGVTGADPASHRWLRRLIRNFAPVFLAARASISFAAG
jgi:hypothetical protein